MTATAWGHPDGVGTSVRSTRRNVRSLRRSSSSRIRCASATAKSTHATVSDAVDGIRRIFRPRRRCRVVVSLRSRSISTPPATSPLDFAPVRIDSPSPHGYITAPLLGGSVLGALIGALVYRRGPAMCGGVCCRSSLHLMMGSSPVSSSAVSAAEGPAMHQHCSEDDYRNDQQGFLPQGADVVDADRPCLRVGPVRWPVHGVRSVSGVCVG